MRDERPGREIAEEQRRFHAPRGGTAEDQLRRDSLRAAVRPRTAPYASGAQRRIDPKTRLRGAIQRFRSIASGTAASFSTGESLLHFAHARSSHAIGTATCLKATAHS